MKNSNIKFVFIEKVNINKLKSIISFNNFIVKKVELITL